MASARNGKIELLRFVFCLCVLFYHINNDMWDGEKMLADGISFFSHGRTGVEFFFLVSGFLTAKSAAKLSGVSNRPRIGTATYDFMLKKINGVFIPHIILCALMFVLLVANEKMTWNKLFEKLSSLLFLQTTGISDNYFLAVEWYLGAMLFALIIVYPLLVKNFDFTSKVVAPVGSSLLIGYLLSKYNQLPSSLEPDPFFTPSNLRGLAVILLGIFCYVISEEIRKADFSKFQSVVVIIVENGCWIFSLLYVISDLSKKFEGLVVYMLALAVSITFSRTFNNKIYNNAFVMYLGKISLTVYLSQNVVRNFVKFNITYDRKITYFILVTILTIALGIIVDWIFTAIRKKTTKNAVKAK